MIITEGNSFLSLTPDRGTPDWTIETTGVVNESLIICSAETYVTSYLFTLSPAHEVMGSKPQGLLKSGENGIQTIPN